MSDEKMLPPIERDEGMDRTYIPIPGGYEIQTKGKGSTFRIAKTDGSGERYPIPLPDFVHDFIEQMARDNRAAFEEQQAHYESKLAIAEAHEKASDEANATKFMTYISEEELKRLLLKSGGTYSIPDVSYRLLDGEAILTPQQLRNYSTALIEQAKAEEREAYSYLDKAEFIGEFKFDIEESCSACSFHEVDENCEICGGEINYTRTITIPWTSVKEIHKAILKNADAIRARSEK